MSLLKGLGKAGKTLAGFVPGVGKAIAANDMVRAQKKALRDLRESDYISPGLLQAVSGAEKRSNATMYAGQDVDQARVDQNAATAMDNIARSTTSSTNLVNAAMGIQRQSDRAGDNISRNFQLYRDGAQRDLFNMLLRKGAQQQANRNQFEASRSALQGAILSNKNARDNAIYNIPTEMWNAALAFKSGMQGGKGGGG